VSLLNTLIIPSINGKTASRPILNNLLDIAVASIKYPEMRQFPNVFTRRYIRDELVKSVIGQTHHATLFYYENYITEFAKQNKCEIGFYNLDGLYDTIENTIKILDVQQANKEANRKSKWYAKIRANKIFNWSKNLVKQTPLKIVRLERKIKTSIVLTHFQLIKKFQVVKLGIITSHISFSLATIKRCPSVSYRLRERVERDNMNKDTNNNQIKTVLQTKFRKRSISGQYDAIKPSKLK